MTIKDIAKESGYAVGTVSRVLNNHPDVSEQARKRILAVVEKNGYIQNANAKNLKQMVNRSILVLVKGTRNELFAALVEKLQGLLNNSPYTLLADYFDEDTDEVLRAITLCAEKKPQGILFLGGNADNFRQSFGRIALPAVLVTSPAEGLEFPNLSSVTTDDFEASVQAVRVLLDRGHRHIAIIGGRPSFSELLLRGGLSSHAACSGGAPGDYSGVCHCRCGGDRRDASGAGRRTYSGKGSFHHRL